MFNSISRAIGRWLASFLSKALPGYQRLDTISIEEFAKVIEVGDVLLVEGNSRISTAIKYLTQSSWSHACLYVGEQRGDVEEPSLIEADLKHGVRLVNLNHYADFNIRICRPANLTESDCQQLLAFARAKIGHQYDMKNVFDLLRFLIQKPAVPNRFRRAMINIGSGEPTKAICSTLIAQSFQSINYPILPLRDEGVGGEGEVPHFYKRHFTHFTPRDFDLSPYFRIVKPTLEKNFDFHNLHWQEEQKGTEA
ncbi:MAG: YiiX/YebB-like N1pC/P60 family cysteine hydrolase [Gammaproteobacteria bacterium]|jgi:hypothetical protein|nr:lipo-like protein [Gammaproteobacteria bacterium]MDP6096117.1 YiiX/YebB-like N1pC/P60 family cysteine hydrolase [Gammaproteobacteria bacterium]MDP7456113.1 YiiX/YebB-like N1pC/P60 family cysteine hydrolase [Gammaproteobacteria bacterium]|tara:strand:+ start:9724 stop:10479 length:756 start_codon:yes stop_codon:yes gene_type:complete